MGARRIFDALARGARPRGAGSPQSAWAPAARSTPRTPSCTAQSAMAKESRRLQSEKRQCNAMRCIGAAARRAGGRYGSEAGWMCSTCRRSRTSHALRLSSTASASRCTQRLPRATEPRRYGEWPSAAVCAVHQPPRPRAMRTLRAPGRARHAPVGASGVWCRVWRCPTEQCGAVRLRAMHAGAAAVDCGTAAASGSARPAHTTAAAATRGAHGVVLT